MTPGSGKAARPWLPRALAAGALLVAVAGAAGEVARRLDDVGLWRRGPAAAREDLLYGPYREVFLFAESRVPREASVLLLSEWDPALIPYYLYPRRIYQLDVDPEYNRVLMDLPPPAYPRRPPESFRVDWIFALRDVGGALVPEFREVGRR